MKTFFLLMLAAVSTVPAAPAAPLEDRPRIVALGYSLTSGRGIGEADAYPAVLQERLDDSGYRYKAQRRRIAVVLVGMDALPIRGWDYSIAFHRAYEQLAARYGITLAPSFLMKVLTDSSLMQSDRAHPNKAGARAIADLVWPHLEPLLTKAH
jgi:lysophospholipase L1-like esterase